MKDKVLFDFHPYARIMIFFELFVVFFIVISLLLLIVKGFTLVPFYLCISLLVSTLFSGAFYKCFHSFYFWKKIFIDLKGRKKDEYTTKINERINELDYYLDDQTEKEELLELLERLQKHTTKATTK